MIVERFPRVTEKCPCNNIHVSGIKCEPSSHLGVSRHLLVRMNENSNTLLQLRSGSIGLSDVKTVVCQKVKNNVYYISCVKCNQVFVVYVGKGSIYGQFSNDLIKDRLRLSEAMLNNAQPGVQFPTIVAQLIKVDEVTRDSAVGYDDGTSEIEGDTRLDHNHSGDIPSLGSNGDYNHSNSISEPFHNTGMDEMMFDGNDHDLDYEIMFSDNHRIIQGSYQAPSALGLYF